jgi:Ca2+-binding EF-hand superfamily protein
MASFDLGFLSIQDTKQRNLQEESVFGMAGNIDSAACTEVFVGLIFILVILEITFSYLEERAKEHEVSELFEKLKKELTMMGILSFVVFVYQTASSSDNQYYEAFEMSHIVILFIAISFIIQASFLLRFAIHKGRAFLMAQRVSCAELVDKYDNMKKSDETLSWMFDDSHWAMPAIPAFRTDIENKLLERFFIGKHKLPNEFRFAHYMSKLFQKYVSELGEVSTINWTILAILIVLNLCRIKAVDHVEVKKLCPGLYDVEEEDEEAENDTVEEEEERPICFEYIYGYAMFIIFLLFVWILTVYLFSAYYHRKLLSMCLVKEDVVKDKAKGRENYMVVLRQIAREETKQEEELLFGAVSSKGNSALPNTRPSQRGSARVSNISPHRPKSFRKSSIGNKARNNSKDKVTFVDNPVHHDDTEMGGDTTIQILPAPDEIPSELTTQLGLPGRVIGSSQKVKNREALKEQQENAAVEAKKEEVESTNWFHEILRIVFPKFFSKLNVAESEFTHIFWFNYPKLYFVMVELVLLLQCFYISIWATQLIPLLAEHDNPSETIGWGIALTFPIFINFGMISLILTRAVMLRAVTGVHAEVLGEVTEEALEEENCIDKLRVAVRSKLEQDEMFFEHTEDPSAVSSSAKDILDNDGKKDDDKNELGEAETAPLTKTRSAGPNAGQSGDMVVDEVTRMKMKMRHVFDHYDEDDSGAIGEAEFLVFLTDLNVYLSSKAFKILWLAIDFDLSGEVSWDELFVILFPELKSEMKKELAVMKKIRDAMANKMISQNILKKTDQLTHMREVFDKFDADDSGTMDVDEMATLIKEYLPEMDDKMSMMVFAAIDLDGEGGIDWLEFRDVFFGVAEDVNRKSLSWF